MPRPSSRSRTGRRIQGVAERGVETLDDRRRRLFGSEECEPARGLEIVQPPFMCRGQLRQHRRALAIEHRDRLDGSGRDLRQGGRGHIAHVVDAAALQVRHRESRAAIRHVRDICAERRIEEHAAQMGARAGAGRSELHLVVVLPEVGGELLETADRQILAHDQHQRRRYDQPDRREVGDRMIGRVAVERLILRVRALGAHHELIAVRRRLGDAQRAVDAAGAALVLDDHLLAQQLGQAAIDDAGEHIGRPAGRERHHHGQGRLGHACARAGVAVAAASAAVAMMIRPFRIGSIPPPAAPRRRRAWLLRQSRGDEAHRRRATPAPFPRCAATASSARPQLVDQDEKRTSARRQWRVARARALAGRSISTSWLPRRAACAAAPGCWPPSGGIRHSRTASADPG